MKENYVTNITDYYVYLNKVAPTVGKGQSIWVTVELDTPWTSELLSQYMDYTKVTTGTIYAEGASYTTYVAEIFWWNP